MGPCPARLTGGDLTQARLEEAKSTVISKKCDLVLNSSAVEVYGNTVTDCTNGIGGTQADRGTDARTGLPYNLKNLYVHNNTIPQQTGFAGGIAKSSTFDDSVCTSWGNHFQNNSYSLSDTRYPYFYWLDQKWTHAQWQMYASEP